MLDILAFSETWLNPSVKNDVLLIDSYREPERKDRQGDSHGGVMLYIKDSIHYKRRHDLEPFGLECIWIEMVLRHKHVLLAHLSRRLIGELIVYQWSGVRRPSVVRPSSSTMLKDLLLRNRWSDQNQILCGASLGRGNDILLAAPGSHDQDDRNAHIW